MIIHSSSSNILPRSIDGFKFRSNSNSMFSSNDLNLLSFELNQSIYRRELPLSGEVERTACSPVMSKDELIRIRDRASSLLSNLRGVYNQIGGGLNAEPFMNSCLAFWNNMEGHSWCIYERDEWIFDQIQERAQGANNLWDLAGNRFESNFRRPLNVMNQRLNNLKNIVNGVDIDISPVIDAYNYFWDANFDFNLYWDLDPELDALMRNYDQAISNSNQLFDRANSKVQSRFVAQFNMLDQLKRTFESAYDHWNNVDGYVGYNKFDSTLPDLNSAWRRWGEFVVLKTPENDNYFQRGSEILDAIRGWFSQFLELPQFSEDKGIKKAGGIASYKFYADTSMLSKLRSIGEIFNKLSKTDLNKYEYRNLFITSLSYEHGGKMPPHSEHREGKDCDLWGVRLDQRKTEFDEERTLELVIEILKSGVSRLIYTHSDIVEKANKKVPNNAVAVSGSGHKDHIHIDVA